MYKARLARLVALIDHTERGRHASSCSHGAPVLFYCLIRAFLARDVLDHARTVVGEHNAVAVLRRVQVDIRHDAEVAVAV